MNELKKISNTNARVSFRSSKDDYSKNIFNKKFNRFNDALIDFSKPLEFEFNNKKFTGFKGDTLASALIANKKTIVARSFKYHRPRGIFSDGTEEPNALVHLRKDAFKEPNTKATTIELYQGLCASSQNHIGPLNFDFMSVIDLFSPFLGAGFYYKTFMWPKLFWEKIYEPIIRASAGLGNLSGKADPSFYDKGFLHCDLLIIGGGPSGLNAALNASKTKLKTILIDDDFLLGGRLNSDNYEINGMAGKEWARNCIEEIKQSKNVRILSRTTVYGSFDHGVYGALERKTDHLFSDNNKPRQILWKIYSKRSILCAGSSERSIAFGNNDRPGVMLSGSINAYINRWGVTPGDEIAIFTNNDSGWKTAENLLNRNIQVSAVIDTRKKSNYKNINCRVFRDARVVDVKGFSRVNSVLLSNGKVVKCDVLGVSGGWNPNLNLTCHHRGKPLWNDKIAAFIPNKDLPVGMEVAGSSNGSFNLNECLKAGFDKSNSILKDFGLRTSKYTDPKTNDFEYSITPFWYVKESKSRSWVDLQNDVTSKDLDTAIKEGFSSVEHLKRYSTLGMATDQGKTSNVLGLGILSEKNGKNIQDSGTTIYRAPYTPVSIGAFAGRSRGKSFKPYRFTPSHVWAKNSNAIFVEVGMWLRAQWYPLPNEKTWRETVDREVIQTRKSVGICDVTTLGKIDIQGKHASEFINRVYANGFAKLSIGKVRYGIMLREDGIAMDDGTTARLSKNHFIMTTTTANAISVFRHLEFCKQCLWPKMDVHLISATEQWAQFAIAGPKSRALIEKIVDKQFDISNENLPFMGCAEISICKGIKARLFRISFSGELAYEIAVPARYGNSLMDLLINVGKEFNAIPYGTEALGVMRIEKGHATGNELNGQISAQNLGMEKFLSKTKDYIGKTLSERSGLNTDNKLVLMGFKPIDKTKNLTAGSHFIKKNKDFILENDEGWLSSVAFSPTLGHSIGIGFIENGKNRIGETVQAVNLLQKTYIDVEIVSPHFYDPAGEKLRV